MNTDDEIDSPMGAGANRVRQMARMFDALALAEADAGSATANSKSNSSRLGSTSSSTHSGTKHNRVDQLDDGESDSTADSEEAEVFADALPAGPPRSNAATTPTTTTTTTYDHSPTQQTTTTTSRVRLLATAFEQLAHSGQRDDLMSIARRCDDERSDEHSVEISATAVENAADSDDQSDIAILLVRQIHDEKSADHSVEFPATLVENPVNSDRNDMETTPIMNDSDELPPAALDSDGSSRRQIILPKHRAIQKLENAFYADLEHTFNVPVRRSDRLRSVVDVDVTAAFRYGANDRLSVEEFYADLELECKSDRTTTVEIDYAALSYDNSDETEATTTTEEVVDARNVHLLESTDGLPDDHYDEDEHGHDDNSEFSDDDNESTTADHAAHVDTPIEPAHEAIDEPAAGPASKVPHIIDELLTNEQNYIQTLDGGIHVYMSAFDEDFNNAALPPALLGLKHHLFGNIDRIRDFHANVFYPALSACNPSDVGAICEQFCRFCREHRFYMYVLYAINSKHGDRIAAQHREYFAERQAAYGDRLGLNSFLLQPIQRLPRYQLLLRELIKELAKYLDVAGVKEQIAACCRAEKHLQRLLDQVNTAMGINDVVDCTEVNVLQQGRFRFVHEFDVYECDSRRRYAGKLFLFERGVLVTEQLDREHLQYRGFYTAGRLGAAELDAQAFVMFDRRPNVRQVELVTEVNAAALWMEALGAMMGEEGNKRRRRLEEGGGGERRGTLSLAAMAGLSMLNVATAADNRDSGTGMSMDADRESLRSIQSYVVVRNGAAAGEAVKTSNTNTVSNGYSSGVSGMSDNSSSSYDSDSKRTTWYTNVDTNLVRNGKTLDRLLNSEKHYIQILERYHRHYLAELPGRGLSAQQRTALRRYCACVQWLIDYHTRTHHAQLRACEQDILAICERFAEALRTDAYLEAYQTYAATCTRAYGVLDAIYAAGGGSSDADALVHYTHVPLEHLDRTYAFMDHLMCELKRADDEFVSDEFKAVARLAVQLNRFRVRVRDNLNLFGMKNIEQLIPNLDDYGLVEGGESCCIYTKPTRLLLLDKGLICVGTKMSSKTQREKFHSLEFNMLRSAVRTTESNQYRERLKISASYARDIEFKVNFANESAKLAMQKRIDVFGHMQ